MQVDASRAEKANKKRQDPTKRAGCSRKEAEEAHGQQEGQSTKRGKQAQQKELDTAKGLNTGRKHTQKGRHGRTEDPLQIEDDPSGVNSGVIRERVTPTHKLDTLRGNSPTRVEALQRPNTPEVSRSEKKTI